MQSVVNYPERGVGGKNTYRGNCSPRLIEDLVKQFKLKNLSDFMVGSGTTEDVCKNHGIGGTYLDLNRGYNMLTMDIPERAENIFWHPPYHDIVVYSDIMYKAQTIIDKFGFDPRIDDLSRCKSWEDFINKMNYCCIKQFCSLEKGGRMFILMGDVKKSGRLYSMYREICAVGTLESTIIKIQNNCVSNNREYRGNFIPIIHEYLMIVRKDNALYFPVQMAVNKQFNVLDSVSVTWLDLISSILEEANAPMSLNSLYMTVEGHKKCNTNKHWKEKIRQTLLISTRFKRVSAGIWALS